MVTYDLNTEKFNNQIELPKVEAIGREIVQYMDSFALKVYGRKSASDDNWETSIWILDDARGKGSWSKKFSVQTHPELKGIYLHLKNGSVVTTSSSSNQNLVLYDPLTKKFETIVGTIKSLKMLQVYNYTESLVSIPGSASSEDSGLN